MVNNFKLPKIMAIILVGVAIFTSACSVLNNRNIASDTSEADEKINKILNFTRSSAPSLNEAATKELKRKTENNLYDIKRNDPLMKIELVQSNELGTDELYKIVVDLDENYQYKMKILHSADAFTDQATTKEFYKFLDIVLVQKVESSFSLMEMLINAKDNDVTSLLALTKLRTLAIDHTINAYTSANLPILESEVSRLEKLVKLERSERIKLGKQRKDLLDVLDKAPENKQFRYFVSVGDRNGAADLIKAYLPWEEMQPFEKKFWEKQLTIMRNPLPVEKRVLIYRGIEDDIIQTTVVEGQKQAVDEALKEQNIFVMSTMMTKNQGTWNRRLRSLQTMNDKFLGTSSKTKDSEFTRAARISTFFKNHSIQPIGSPFLSFTPSFDTAMVFGKKRISAYLIDPRALVFNYANRHTHEAEYLLPLATFPDEIYAVHDVKLSEELVNVKKDTWIKKQVLLKLMREQGEAQGVDTFTKIQANSKNYFNHYANKDPELDKALEIHAAEVAKLPIMGPFKPTDSACKNILKSFW